MTVANGVISDKSHAAKKVSYGELIGGQHFDVTLEWNKQFGNDLAITGKGKPKSPVDYKLLGKGGVRRRDVPPKVLGTLDYMVDVKVPGMLHGRMIRPPIAGAVPTAIDEDSVRDIPGVKVVWKQGFIGVVAPREWDAIRASEKLKITWSDTKPPFPNQAAIYEHIRKAEVVHRDVEQTVGDVDAVFTKAGRVVEQTYEWPFQSHAGMAPACGVADVRNGEATIWSGTQKPHYAAQGVAKMLNLPADKVKCVAMTGPGSYGRNDAGDATMDAAVLSQAVGKEGKLKRRATLPQARGFWAQSVENINALIDDLVHPTGVDNIFRLKMLNQRWHQFDFEWCSCLECGQQPRSLLRMIEHHHHPRQASLARSTNHRQ